MQTQRRTNGARLRPNSYIENNKRQEIKAETATALAVTGVLSVLIPPIGLFLTWRSRQAPPLTRLLFSLVGFSVMTGVFILLLGSGQTSVGILPVPVIPDRAGYVRPTQSAAAEDPYALSVYDTAGQTDTGYVITYGDGTAEQTGIVQNGELPMDPTAGLTLVYAVTNNAVYYHLQKTCDLQTNSRTMTLEDAQAEGLLPCEKCAADTAN